MTGNKKNTLTTHTTKPTIPNLPQRPNFANLRKPVFKGPSFNSSNAFRNQNRGSGGK